MAESLATTGPFHGGGRELEEPYLDLVSHKLMRNTLHSEIDVFVVGRYGGHVSFSEGVNTLSDPFFHGGNTLGGSVIYGWMPEARGTISVDAQETIRHLRGIAERLASRLLKLGWVQERPVELFAEPASSIPARYRSTAERVLSYSRFDVDRVLPLEEEGD